MKNAKNMAVNHESSILMDNVELRRMASEIVPATQKYSKSEEVSENLPFKNPKAPDSSETSKDTKNKVFERLISQKVKYFHSSTNIEKACAEEIATRTPTKIRSQSNAAEVTKPRTSSVSELILSIHSSPDEYFPPDFDSRCSIETEMVYRETTSPKKKKTLKKRMNRLFKSCVCGSNRYYNFNDIYERRISSN